jgi:precorrin-4 C11-methyltransferase
VTGKASKANKTSTGIVYFIGAGPGDPELLTLKAQRLIGQADVIIYAGSLVNDAVLSHARPDAKRYNSAGMNLAEQIVVMAAAVQQGQIVARLHTGDPAIYGATLEQMRELDRRNIPYAVVPGVSSALAAAAALGIEFTVPGDTQTVIFTRLSGRTPVPETERLQDLAAHRTSLAIFLSAGMIGRVVEELQAAGYSPDTPLAVIFRASWPDQLIVRGVLVDIAAKVEQAEITHHALIIVSPALHAAKSEAAPNSHLYGTAMLTAERQSTPAIITLTRQGTQTGLRLHKLLPDSVLYAPAKFVDAPISPSPNLTLYTTSVRQVLQSAFQEHRALICLMAAGIVVRDLAPLLRSKHSDPAVVVVDEQGQYAVSLLSGHKGGANALARQVAGLLGGTPVLTTASDGQGLPAVDLLGSEWGWIIGRSEQLTAVSAALVNGEPVGVVQEAGEESWRPDPLPPNLTRYASLDALEAAAPAAALIITHREIPAEILEAVPQTVVYHPPCLAIGLGCNRGAPAAEILAAIDQTLAEAGLAADSIRQIATIEDKADEAGLLAACEIRGWELRTFSREEVSAVTDLPNPSAWAQRALGVPGVAEPAALLAAGTDTLLVEKRKFANVTVAVAQLPSIQNRKS